jgi:hypothetical protein
MRTKEREQVASMARAKQGLLRIQDATRSDAALPVVADCKKCWQPLQEWEAEVCEGCGMEKSNG